MLNNEVFAHPVFRKHLCDDGTEHPRQGSNTVWHPHQNTRVAWGNVEMIHVETCKQTNIKFNV